MERSATNGTATAMRATTGAELPDEQQAALTALLSGQTVTAAAAAVGVARTTLHRWLREDEAFAAAYNGRRAELRDAAHARLLGLADKALAALERALDEGDTRAAAAVLRGLGLLSGAPLAIGGDTPEGVRRDRALAEQERRNEELFARLPLARR